jgi:hypothetical protein
MYLIFCKKIRGLVQFKVIFIMSKIIKLLFLIQALISYFLLAFFARLLIIVQEQTQEQQEQTQRDFLFLLVLNTFFSIFNLFFAHKIFATIPVKTEPNLV